MGSKVKKTFSMIFYFHVHCRENMVLIEIEAEKNIVWVGLKGKKTSPSSKVKNIIFFCNLYQKTWCVSIQRLTVKTNQRF